MDHLFSRTLRLSALTTLLLCSGSGQAQLIFQQLQSPATLVQTVLLGPQVFGSNVFFNGVPGNIVPPVGSGPSEMGRFNGSYTSLGLTGGLFLCTGVATAHLPGPNDRLSYLTGGMSSGLGYETPDLDLSTLTGDLMAIFNGGNNIYNKALLEFDVVPLNDMLSFRYVFSSEEYERWACSPYNDAFGFFVSGPGISGPFTNNAMNIAFIPGSLSAVSINTVNSGAVLNNMNGPISSPDPFEYCQMADPNWLANTPYYRYNGGQWPDQGPLQIVAQLEAPYNNDPYYIQHNGMTVVLTASAAVQIGESYHFKLGVSNVRDGMFPSAVFLENNSLRASDRFTLTVDEGPNVDLSGLAPVLHESHTDSVYLRFNRWGGFYLDEHLQLSVQGNAIAGVDYMPALPDSVHFNQLDSAAVIALALPVHADTTRELLIDLISSNGDKVMSYTLIIDKEVRDNTGLAERAAEAPILFPNPTDGTLHVVLPGSLTGATDLHVLDLAGRVVLQHRMNGTPRTTLDVSSLPNGLYVLKTMTEGRVGAARFHVRH